MSFNSFKVTNEISNANNLRIDLKAGIVKGSLSGIVFIDKDTKQYVSYMPALDISGYGETQQKAEEMITFSLTQFFDYLFNLTKSEVDSEMRKYGWKKSIFNKQFSKSFIDINGVLQNFNVEENSINPITLTAA